MKELGDFLGEEKQAAIRVTADAVVRDVVKKWLGEEQRNRGGYCRMFALTARDFRELVPLCEFWLGGNGNRNETTRHKICSFEQAVRLAYFTKDKHRSSFQSAVPDLLQAGAILFHCVIPECGPQSIMVIFTFSGLPEMANEAVTVALAEKMEDHGWQPNKDDLVNVLKASNNLVYQGALLEM